MAKNNHPRSTDGRGIFVQVRNGNVEQAIRKLKKKVTNEGIIQEVRDRQAFGVPYWAPTIVLLKKENKHDKTNETNYRQPA
jgi:ribosomal protein S21